MSEAKNIRASDTAYQIIKNAIIERKLQPGEKLGKRAMAELCGMSIIPVIDALNRLESEGLVESNPNKASRVVALNDEKIADMFILREAIEVQVVRILCFNIGLTEANELKAMAEKIDAMSGKPEKDSCYDELHYRFHHRLAELTGSRTLLNEMERLQFFSLLVKSENTYTALEKSLITTDFSHADIIIAILKRNPEEAQAIMRDHIYRSQVVATPYWAQGNSS
jgi:DNA-binding GntR family transcriptional regulator